MGFDGFKIFDSDAGLFQGHLRRRGHRGGHVGFLARATVTKLNGHGLIRTEFLGFLLGGDDESGIAVGGMGLGAKGDTAPG